MFQNLLIWEINVAAIYENKSLVRVNKVLLRAIPLQEESSQNDVRHIFLL